MQTLIFDLIGGLEKNKPTSKRRKGTQGRSISTKYSVMGLVQRGGEVITKHIPEIEKAMGEIVKPSILENFRERYGFKVIISNKF